jgi:hypothetical protein
MTSPQYRVRRATLDDLTTLKGLWNSMHFPADDLEKRLTEFQVVESSNGKVIGAIGVQIVRPHGQLHHEAYEDFALADEVRPLLLERIRLLASNHGVFRLWTREKSPFWSREGFGPATPELLRKIPEIWAEPGPEWATLQLKDEETLTSMEKELALYMETEKRRTQRALGRVRIVKVVATFFAILFAIFVAVAIFFFFRKNPAILTPGR